MKFKYLSKRRFAALTLSTVMLGSIISLSGCKKDKDTIAIYSQIIEENNEESNVLKYIEVSKKINDAKLDTYTFDRNNNVVLDTPKNITDKVEKYKSDKKVNVTNVDYLKNQEVLVNEYIYNHGYPLANTNVTISVKEYAAELYGLKPEFIEFNCWYEKTNGKYSVYLIYKEETVYKTTEVTDENLIKGVISMTKTSMEDDNMSDNCKYNKGRNNAIETALIESYRLNNINEQNDLYNQKAAQKINK